MNTETTIETNAALETELEADMTNATADTLIEGEQSAVQQPAQARSKKGPGSRLQSARLTAKLSIDDVAEKLYLTKTIIEAIEKDDYQKTPALTFVRGYLRSYARLVKLSSDEIVASFDSLGLTDRCPKMPTEQIHRRQGSFFSRALPWLIAVAAVIVVGLVFIFWQSQDSKNTASSTPTLPTAPTAQVSINGSSPSQIKLTVQKVQTTLPNAEIQNTAMDNTKTQNTAIQNNDNSPANSFAITDTPSTPINSKKPTKLSQATKPSTTTVIQKKQSFWF